MYVIKLFLAALPIDHFDSYADGHDVKLSTFIDTDGTTADDSFLDEVVRPLLAQVDVDSSLKAFYRILQHRAEHMDFPVDPPDLQWSPASWTSVRAITIGRLCTQMLSRLLDGVLGFHEHAMAIMQYLNEVIVVIPAAEPDIYRRIVELSTDDKFKLNISYELRVQLLSLTVRLQDRFGNPDSKGTLRVVKKVCIFIFTAQRSSSSRH